MRHLDAAIDSAEYFDRVWPDGDAFTLLVAFHNCSTGGTLSAEPAADKQWLCYELDCTMNKIAEACRDLDVQCTVWSREEL